MVLESILGLAITYGVAYVASHTKYSYKKVYWIFEAAHIAAGIFLAMFFSNFFSNPWQIICLAIGVGFVWEVAEYAIWTSPWRKIFLKKGTITLPDTLLDLALDALGAMVFIFFVR